MLSHKQQLKLPAFHYAALKDAGNENSASFINCLIQNYTFFVRLLFKLFTHKKESVRLSAMRLMVEGILPAEAALLALRGEVAFPTRLFERLFVAVLQLPSNDLNVTNPLLDILIKEFVNKYADAYILWASFVRQWSSEQKLYSNRTSSVFSKKEGATEDSAVNPAHELPSRVGPTCTAASQSTVVFSCLMRLSVPERKANQVLDSKQLAALNGKNKKAKAGLSKATDLLTKPTLRSSNAKQYTLADERKAFADAWLSLAKAEDMSDSVTRGLLKSINVQVLPYLSAPLQTADLYIRAFDVSLQRTHERDTVSNPRTTPFDRTREELLSMSRRKEIIRSHSTCVAALSGLFSLIARYRMGDTDIIAGDRSGVAIQEVDDACNSAADSFFSRLYKLVSPASLRIEGATDSLLELLELSLRSSLVPHKLKAAFCKRMLRTAMLTPASSSVALLALTANLMNKNRATLRGLVDLSREAAQMWSSLGDSTFEFDAPPMVCDAVAASDATSQERAAGLKRKNDKSLSSVERYSDEDDFQNIIDKETMEVEKESKKRRRLLEETEGAFERSLKQLASVSLWELAALKRHISPGVAQLGAFFWSDFLNVMIPKPIDVGAAMGHSEASLVEQELKLRLKHLPATGVQCPPKLSDIDGLFESIDELSAAMEDEDSETESEDMEEHS